ncbi:MAG: hypothetical protein S4CHLAM37_16910 [Chlamydiia bacterium]|nr:hypothetical protein [Chlamydiia bacterium]
MVEKHNISSTIKKRWSPRAMSGEPLSEAEYQPLFEAARLAPSCFNSQPWRFLMVKKESKRWEDVYSSLTEYNQGWTKNAAMLVVLTSRLKYEKNDKEANKHSLDAGAAWENLALEGFSRDLVVHAMEGFHPEKLRESFSIPDLYHIEIVIAIGKPAPVNTLEEKYQVAEKPKERKPLAEILNEDEFIFT